MDLIYFSALAFGGTFIGVSVTGAFNKLTQLITEHKYLSLMVNKKKIFSMKLSDIILAIISGALLNFLYDFVAADFRYETSTLSFSIIAGIILYLLIHWFPSFQSFVEKNFGF